MYSKRNERIKSLLRKAGEDVQMNESTTSVEHLENLEKDLRRQASELGMLLEQEKADENRPKTIKKIGFVICN